jgi:hypothetical protein
MNEWVRDEFRQNSPKRLFNVIELAEIFATALDGNSERPRPEPVCGSIRSRPPARLEYGVERRITLQLGYGSVGLNQIISAATPHIRRLGGKSEPESCIRVLKEPSLGAKERDVGA